MKIIGHRGARGLAPENTLASLRKALEHHVDELEFDLRVTGDGVVILHHDKQLTDPNGQKHLIKDSSYAELKEHKPDLATLSELLAEVGSTPLYLEVKPGERIRPIVKLLKSRRHISVGSKSQPTLLALHQALPDIPKIVIHPWSGVIATHRARQVGTKRLSMNQRWLWSGFLRSISRNYQLSAYTLNDTKKAKRWARYGLYGVVTDYPDRFEKLR